MLIFFERIGITDTLYFTLRYIENGTLAVSNHHIYRYKVIDIRVLNYRESYLFINGLVIGDGECERG